MHEPLTDEEFEALDDLLLETPGLDQAMDLCMLDGFAAALACAPDRQTPETWIRWVWDCQDGRGRPEFASEAGSRHLFSLILRHVADVAITLQDDPQSYEPILMEGEAAAEVVAGAGNDSTGGAAGTAAEAEAEAEAAALAAGPVLVIDEWCAGFLRGLALDAGHWQAVERDHPEWLHTIRLYGVAESLEQLHQMRLPLAEHQQAALGLAQAVRDMHAWFAPARGRLDADVLRGAMLPDTPVRNQAKVGRNEPCPCGSGRKAKQCGCQA